MISSMSTSFTKKQLARMPEFRERWRGYGLSCEPADRKLAEQGITKAYRVAGMPPPKIIWCGSPKAGLIARSDALSAATNKKLTDTRGMVAGRSVTDNILYSIKERVGKRIRGKVKQSVWNSVSDNVGEGITSNVLRLRGLGITMLNRGIWSDVALRIHARIDDRLRQYGESLESRVQENRFHGFIHAIFGQHDCDWLANIDYFKSIVGLQMETEDLNGISMISQSAGWFWPHEKICWICERTESVNLDEDERVHNNRGPAISFRDGWKIYASHGVILPDWITEAPQMITPSKIDKEQNAEIRRVKIELFGQERYLKEGESKLVGSSSFGRLWKKELRDDEPIVMVELLNSTPEIEGSLSVKKAIAAFGEDAQVNHDGMMMRLCEVPDGLRFKGYFLRVPPTCRTPRAAVAWTFNKTEDEYDLIVQS